MDSLTPIWKQALQNKIPWSQVRQKLFAKLEIAVHMQKDTIGDILFLYSITFTHQYIEFERKRVLTSLIETKLSLDD